MTIYDPVKMVEPALVIENIKLLTKSDGKHALWLCPDGVPPWVAHEFSLNSDAALKTVRCAIVALSDRTAAGVYEDKSGIAPAILCPKPSLCFATA